MHLFIHVCIYSYHLRTCHVFIYSYTSYISIIYASIHSCIHIFISFTYSSHVFIYSYTSYISIIYASIHSYIHIIYVFLSCLYLFTSLMYFYHVYIYSFTYSLFIALLIYVFTIHSIIHMKIQTLAKSRDFSTHV